jgi:hypothetical protein
VHQEKSQQIKKPDAHQENNVHQEASQQIKNPMHWETGQQIKTDAHWEKSQQIKNLMCIGFFNLSSIFLNSTVVSSLVWSSKKHKCSPIQKNHIYLLCGCWELEISHQIFKYLSSLILLFSTTMSHSLPTNTEVLASTLLSPIFGQSLQATAHTPRKRVLGTAEEQIPKKCCLLVSNDHINTVLASFCCHKKCLDNFSFADILNITQPFADLNEHNCQLCL